MAAHQTPLYLGFSRQEHWSGLPFPSPMHESEKWKWSHVQLLANPWTTAYQAPPSMGFSRQEYWSGVPLPSPTSGWEYAFILLKSESVCQEFSIKRLRLWSYQKVTMAFRKFHSLWLNQKNEFASLLFPRLTIYWFIKCIVYEIRACTHLVHCSVLCAWHRVGM